MRGKYRPHHILEVVLLFIALAGFSESNSKANENSKYLDAVREFADNVLKYGRDTYGPKHTPLFVDGLNIHTHEPVKWISPKGDYSTATDTEKWILSNFASQQTLLRTLDGLSSITGDTKYQQAAMDAIKYAFDHLRTPSGIFYWGHMTAYDALGDTPHGNTSRESIKLHYPYYELMWEVDPQATKKLIEALWCAHIVDWSNLDMNRIGPTTANQEEPWNHEYDEEGPTFFKGKSGGGFFSTGTSLVQASTALHKLSGQEQSLIWGKRLAKRFVDTRHPRTGISAFIYNGRLSLLGDNLKEHFADPYTTIFPLLPFEEGRGLYHPQNQQALPWISLFLVGDMLGEKGSEFTKWALEELTAWGKEAYRKKDNSFIPILTDGTNIEGYICKESSRDAPRGSVTKSLFADPTLFWGYTVAYRTTGDEFAWQMTRDIACGNDFGDIGEDPTETPSLRVDTNSADVFSLLGFLELFRKTKNPPFREMARRIGDNIINNQLYKGFFVPSKKHIYTRFDCFEPLALLHLHATIKSKTGSVPEVWPSSPLFVPAYRYKQEGVDRRIIYTLTESIEPPLSLQEAAAIGDVNMVRSLLEKGVEVDSWDGSHKKTALQRAAMSGHKDVVELLLAKGARIDAQDDWPGGTALDYAAEKGHKEIAELLIARGADANAKRTYPAGDTPLHSALRAGHKDIIELLITKGADVNAKNNNGQTPLDIAVTNNRKDIIELLLAKGADTSIHVAALIGDLARVRTFLEEGTNVNVKDDSGYTPFHYAIWYSKTDIARLLIEKGADIRAKDQSGYTPLHWAVIMGNKELTELVLAKGADVNVRGKAGETPLDFAIYYEAIGLLLVQKGAEVTSIQSAAFIGDLNKVKAFIGEGADVNNKNVLGITALHVAASASRKEVAEFLIVKGADINASVRNGETPLHWAARAASREVVELLISKGADVNAKDKRGRTPLSLAEQRGHTEIVELLRKHGIKE
ncbi:MAG: ankyrin repeat domain-containing protein [Phycisphaerae bacterium]